MKFQKGENILIDHPNVKYKGKGVITDIHISYTPTLYSITHLESGDQLALYENEIKKED